MQTRKSKNPGQKNTILFIKMDRGVRLISPNHLRIFFQFFQYVFNNFVSLYIIYLNLLVKSANQTLINQLTMIIQSTRSYIIQLKKCSLMVRHGVT